MCEKKNQVAVIIEDCQHCPNATLKLDRGSGEEIMYCQTCRGIMMLRDGWGSRSIPDWCPRLYHNTEPLRAYRDKRVKIPGIVI